MNDTSNFDIFPKAHIQPYDGMLVTAAVWAEAHNEHRQAQKAHDVVFHGSGIIIGLEVVANDPADQYVFISPGVAVDPVGNIIVVNEPVAYDFGSAVEGELFLLLGHGEREIGGVNQEIRLIQDEFVIAARSSLPRRPAVELARVRLTSRGAAIQNAADPAHPAAQELDLRFRRSSGPQPKRLIRVAVVALGDAQPGDGWDHLARECARSTSYQLVVDNGLDVAAAGGYDLVCLCGSGAFKLEAAEVKVLTDRLAQGLLVFADAQDEAAAKAFQTLAQKAGVEMAVPAEGHPLWSQPYLFSAPPQGGSVWAGKGWLVAGGGCVVAWGGRGLSRADIRSAHEWGINLLHWLLN